MEISMFLSPVPDECFTDNFRPGKDPLSKSINIFRSEDDFPDLTDVKLAIIGTEEDRNAVDNAGCGKAANEIRKSLYILFNRWENLRIVDLGNIKMGNQPTDSYFALRTILLELLKKHIVPIVIGGSHDNTYPMYLAYEETGRLINITSIDPIFDLGNDGEQLNAHSFLSHIITYQPSYLFNFSNIGYQNYYVDNEGVELMKELLFDVSRFGNIKAKPELAEPLIRNANLVTIDMSAIRAADAPGIKNASPNGFNGEEICRMMRYAGLSSKLSSIGIFEYNPVYDQRAITANLAAEMIWYFIDGFMNRIDDMPSLESNDFKRYNVQIDDVDEDVVFLYHKISGKWWIDLSFLQPDDPRYERHHFIPCSRDDYEMAMQNELPDKWWQFYQKLM